MTMIQSYGVPITANTVDQHTHTHNHDINATSNNTSTGGRHTHGLGDANHMHKYSYRPTANNTNVNTYYPGNSFAGYALTAANKVSTVTGPFTTGNTTGNYTYGNTTVNMANTRDYFGTTRSDTEYVYYYDGLARTWNYLIIKAH